jgi:chromosome segregation ATPase
MMGTREVHQHGPHCQHEHHSHHSANENMSPLAPQQQLHQNQTVGSLRARFKKLSKDMETATEQMLHLQHQLSSAKHELKESEKRNGILNALVQSLRKQQEQLNLQLQQQTAVSSVESNLFTAPAELSLETQRIKELEQEVERLKYQRDQDRQKLQKLELEVFEAMEFVEHQLASNVHIHFSCEIQLGIF